MLLMRAFVYLTSTSSGVLWQISREVYESLHYKHQILLKGTFFSIKTMTESDNNIHAVINL